MNPEGQALLRRGVAEVIVQEELQRLLGEGRPLRLKLGLDPSRPDLHLGHMVVLRKLAHFQRLGHQVVLIVGDWTAQIGDPSGQTKTRLMLSPEEVKQNADTYMKQFFKVVDPAKTEVLWQSQWYSKFDLGEVIKLSSKFTVAQLLSREDFATRYSSGRPIAITELLYPLLQAYDSVMVKADVEFGGVDQKFNCLLGRELQGIMGQRPQQVFLVPILVGLDGLQKMSKSLDNYIAIDEPATEMYGKVMSLPDSCLMPYFEMLTEVSDQMLAEMKAQLQAQAVNPMELKKRLAREIVAQFHSPQATAQAEAHFTRVFQQRRLPEDIPEYRVHVGSLRFSYRLFHPEREAEQEGGDTLADVADLLLSSGLVKSRGEAKRLLSQGAVEIDGKKVLGAVASVRDGSIIRVGKQRFLRLRLTSD